MDVKSDTHTIKGQVSIVTKEILSWINWVDNQNKLCYFSLFTPQIILSCIKQAKQHVKWSI